MLCPGGGVAVMLLSVVLLPSLVMVPTAETRVLAPLVMPMARAL